MNFKKINEISQINLKKINVVDVNNVYIGNNVEIGENVTIYPGVIIGDDVKIGNNVTIYAYANITDKVQIMDDCVIGQYSIIRSDCIIGSKTIIGPHNEICRSILGHGCAIGHKNYIGDAVLMDGVKFGAGAIIANTNWNERFKTFIGENTKIGVNATLIAPLNIGKNCFIAAGVTFKGNLEDNKFVRNNNELVIKENKY